jgi:Flp pilus assembly protein TadG
MLRILRRFIRDVSGGPILEFAIAGPVVVTGLIGCLEYGRFFWVRNTLEYAVEEAGRYHILNKSASQSDIQTQVRNKVMGVDPTTITVTVVSTPGTGVTFKTITADGGNFGLLSGNLLPVSALPLKAETRVPVAN